MLELWHEWNSVHSFKVRVTLAEKGLQWVDRRLELLKFEHLRPAYLRLNPGGVVPTLVHDGQAVMESSVICQYIDEAFVEPALLPPVALGRARCRAWLKYFDDVVHPPIRRASFELLYRPQLARMTRSELRERLLAHPDSARAEAFMKAAESIGDPRVLADSIKTFERIIVRIEQGLEGNDWLSGSVFGLADVAMAPFVERLDSLSLNELWTLPQGRAWADRVMRRPAIAHSRPPSLYRLFC